MSTLTECLHCGEEMQFAVMKTHLESCDGRPLPTKPRESSLSTHATPAAAGRAISGLEFYHRLNKLSRLTRLSRSPSSGDNDYLTASSRKSDARAIQQNMRSPSSVDIHVAHSNSPSAASPRRYASAEPRGRPSPSWATYSDVSGGPTSPPATARQSSPLAYVNLRSTSRETDVSSSGVSARLRPASCTSSSFRSPSANSLSATPAALPRASSSRPKSVTEYTSAAARHYRGASHSHSNASRGESELPNRHQTSSIRTALPSAPRATDDGVLAVVGDSALPSTIAELSSTRSAAPTTSSATCAHKTRVAASSANLAVSSLTSSHRPMPQLSSFAIRLRGSQGSLSSAPKAAQGSSRGPSGRLCESDDGDDTKYGNGDNDAIPFLGPVSTDIAQMKISLRQMQQLVQHQQVQCTALLQAHGDLRREITAQRDSFNGMARRSMSEVAAMKAALQKHTKEVRRELTAVQESVTSLWATLSDVQKRLRNDARSPAKPLEAPPCPAAAATSTSIRVLAPPSPFLRNGAIECQQARYTSQLVTTPLAPNGSTENRHEPSASIIVQRSLLGEESAYYSDIASFIQPDARATSSLSASLPSRKGASPVPAQASGSVFTSGLVHPSASSSVSASRFVPKGWAPSGTAARAPLYAMDVQQRQQRHCESMEDRVVSMLHGKPTVVVRSSSWK